jgi:hypothetical protein
VPFLLFAALLLLILTVFYWPWLCGTQSFYLSDLTYYFEPLIKYISLRLQHGELPLWNPYCFCGMSQIAIPSPGVFYPPNWIWAFLPFSSGLAASMVFHQWITGIGAFLLVSELGWGVAAAIVCGSVIALCGYMFSLQTNFTLVDSIAWLPLCLWSLHCIGRSENRLLKSFYFTLAGLCVALLLLAGRPEVGAPSIVLITSYIFVSAYYANKKKKGSAGTTALLCCSAILFGILLSMPGILPALEWATLSTRAHGLSNQDIFTWSANWYDFINMVLAQPLGNLYVRKAIFLAVAAPRINYIPFVGSCYVGPVVITLAIWGLLDHRCKLRPYLLLMLVGSIVMSLGSYTPIAPVVMNLVHGAAVFRYPEKLLVFVLFSIALFAARGMHTTFKNELKISWLKISAEVWLVWLIVMSILSVPFISNHAASFFTHSGISGAPLALLAQALVLIGHDGLIAGAIGLIPCLAVWLMQRRKLPPFAFAAITLVILNVGLVSAACATSRHGTEQTFFQHSSFLFDRLRALGFNGSTRILSLFFDPVTYPTSFEGFPGEDATARFYQYGRQLLLPNTNMDALTENSYGYEASQRAGFRKQFLDAYNLSSACTAIQAAGLQPNHKFNDQPLWQLCRTSNTEFAVAQLYKNANNKFYLPLLDPRYFKVLNENEALNFRIYRVLDPLPRIYFAGLPEDTGIKVLNDKPENLVLRINASFQRLLVVSDQYYPGWKATIDGAAATIHELNGAFRSVIVPAGTHIIKFSYEPDSLFWGLILAATGIGIWSAIIGAIFCQSVVSPRSSTDRTSPS